MSETLLGVLLGGLIGVFGSMVALAVEHRRWRREKLLEYLRDRRRQLEVLYKEVHQGVTEGLKHGRYDIEVVTNATYLCPRPVTDAFTEFMRSPKASEEEVQEELYKLSMAMKNSLAELDRRISDEA